MTTQESFYQLFTTPAWWEDCGIQASTARSYKKRFLEGKLALDTQIELLEKAGFSKVVEMRWKKKNSSGSIRQKLIEKLKAEKVFWSYASVSDEQFSDALLIEKVLMHLDLEDSIILFELFHRKRIQMVWRTALLSQEPMYHNMNRLYARIFFGITDPDRYIREYKKKATIGS